MSKINLKNVLLLVFALAVCYFVAFVGSMFTTPFIDTWYAGLAKPPISPPDWIFGPVWTVLYFLMGVSFFLILKESDHKKAARVGVWVFAVQLVLNGLWSILFFGLQNPLAALIEIAALWVFIMLTMWQFAKMSLTAGWLLVPYALWVSFAAVLNFWIWYIN